MNRDKMKMVIIYVLIFIILGLVGYLIYFSLNQNTKTEEKKPAPEQPKVTERMAKVAASCTFDVNLSEFGEMLNDSTKLCDGLNKYNISGITLDGKEQKIVVIYNNGTSANKTGIYLNDQKIISKASTNNQNILGVFDSKLFILSKGQSSGNVEVYNGQGISVYNLSETLSRVQINDAAFIEINKTNPTFNSILSIQNIDMNSFSFAEGEFTFSSDTKLGCNGYAYKGSSYKVTYKGNSFEAPAFINTNACQ